MANPFFNASYYLANNQDLYLAGVTLETAEAHYLQYGAKEVASGTSTRVGPNPWFDASFYLLNNPDLVAAGLTVSDALNHYATYGVNEGRDPSAALKVADFTAKLYADTNKDVAAALGITDTSALTAAQTSQLLSHYLAYGYVEGRQDAGINAGSAAIDVKTGVNLGTDGNDVFNWNGAGVADASVKGLAGTDTLNVNATPAHSITVDSIEKINAKVGGTLTVIGSGVQSVDAANTLIYNGAKVDTFNLSDASVTAVSFTPSTVAGTADALAVNVAGNAVTAAGAATLTVNGIETVNVNLGTSDAGTASVLNLNANSVNGSSLTVTVAGGKADAVATDTTIDSTVTLNSTTSPTLVNVTLDGSANVGDQALTVGLTLASVNATVTGGSGDDTLTTLTAKGHTATLNGGAGVDTLVASLGQDTMTGGAGKDIFQFDAGNAVAVITGTGAAATISAVDTVTDFSAGDTVKLAGAVNAGAVGTIGNVDAKGVLTFTTGFIGGGKTLTEIVTALNTDVAAGDKVLFQLGADTYAFSNTAGGIEADGLVKLVGVDSTKLTAIAADIQFTPV